MKQAPVIAVWALGLIAPLFLVRGWLGDAKAELASYSPEASQVAVAQMAEESWCNANLKKIVRRVAGACGLLGGDDRGCRPADAAKVVELSDADFNALFVDLKERVSILQFDKAKSDLDPQGMALVDSAWADRRGASFFFVVARASPEGNVNTNRELSEARANAVMTHLETRFADPDIRKQVGLLWLGEEFAQLGEDFCTWKRSRGETPCTADDINRSAFIAWIDCAI